MVRLRHVLALVVVLASAAAGCRAPGPARDWPGTDWAGAPYGEACNRQAGNLFGSPPPTQPLPSDAVLVAATRCMYESEFTGDGEWLRRLEQEATTGALQALATALRLPPEPFHGQLCPQPAYAPIVITVTDQRGRTISPTIPATACGVPFQAVTDAIVALPWITTASVPHVVQLRTQQEVLADCPASAAAFPLPRVPGDQPSTLDTTARELQACRYDLASHATGPYDGTLVRAWRLGGGP
jgi:hypothetical protein